MDRCFYQEIYCDTLLDSIRSCQNNKGLLLHCWCLMSNHIHLIASARNHDLNDVLRDFKKFTSKTLITAIAKNPQESRKNWMLDIFRREAEKNSRNKEYQFWKQDNHPEELYSPSFVYQKINYTHNNPVEARIVDHPWEYRYSSASDYHFARKCGLLELSFL